MRPIDKGKDQGYFKPWGKAQNALLLAIGSYCSYCERWIACAIEVEHVLPKNEYKSHQYRWSNFLLACKNCNAGKGHGVINLPDFLWPDCDNTSLAFCYDSAGRIYPNPALPTSISQKATKLWKLANLNWHDDTAFPEMVAPSEKDHRYLHRRQAWVYASDKRSDLVVFDSAARRATVIQDALQRGMFSIWMAVFSQHSKLDREMRILLIQGFSGTAKNCFNKLGNPCKTGTGQL